MAMTSRAISMIASTPANSSPSPSSSATVMYSGAIAATIGRHAAGVATLTSPAPDRSAPIADRCAAPVLPIEPATINTWP